MGKSNAARKIIPIEDGKKMDDGFLDALEKSENTKPKAKKSSGSAEAKSTPKIAEAIDAYNKAKADKKVAEAKMKKNGSVILDHVKKIQDKDGFDGNFTKSYDIEGNKDKVKYVSSNRFTVNNDDVNLIKEILGENFDNFIKKTWKIWVKPSVLESRASQKELMEIMGERFTEFLETSSSLVPCDDFDRKVYSAFDCQEDLDDLRTFIKPYKAALK